MRCCPNCFSHEWLKEHIRQISKERGQCDCCGEEDAPVVEAGELGGLFDNMLSMYVPADDFETGDPLIGLVQWHWQIFNEDALTDDMQVELLEDIANSDWHDDDGESPLDARELYVPPAGQPFHTTHRERWEEFCSDVREDPEASLPFEDYLSESLYELEVTLRLGSTLYRARRGFELGRYGDRISFRGDAIGAPPKEKAFAGRANVEGQEVLYCADQEQTAIAEQRPPRGYYVSVCTVTLNRDARLVDLTKETDEINPFLTQTLKWDVEIQSLLNAFGEEMSRPLERDDDKTHYLACQRLADFIREAGFDGIRYPSAINPEGTNVVFFDPGVATIGESKLAKITEAQIEYEFDETKPIKERLRDAVKQNAAAAEPEETQG